MARPRKEKTEKELRDFGFIMTIAFVVIAAIILFKGSFNSLWALGIALVFYEIAIFAPKRLRLAERYWMIFGEKLGAVVNVVVLSALYFLVITPLGIGLRVFGKDLLDLEIDRNAKSYWNPVEVDGPATRPYKPY